MIKNIRVSIKPVLIPIVYNGIIIVIEGMISNDRRIIRMKVLALLFQFKRNKEYAAAEENNVHRTIVAKLMTIELRNIRIKSLSSLISDLKLSIFHSKINVGLIISL
jgi:hypothetical protein